jgi:outer membrane protein assembly factor BamB
MTNRTSSSTTDRALRLRPGVVILIVQFLLFFGVPLVAPDAEMFGLPLAVIAMFGGPIGGVAILLWWLFFSRAPWIERIGAIVLMIVGIMITRQVAHESMVGAHMGVSLYIFPIPWLCLALVLWAAMANRLERTARAAALVALIAIACLPWTLIRTAGVMGAGSEYHLRWTPTPEELLLAQSKDEPPPPASAVVAPTPTTSIPANLPPAAPVAAPIAPPASSSQASKTAAQSEESSEPVPVRKRTIRRADWPGFRGPNRDSVIHGGYIATDWAASPPEELWRRAVGPGWSSFAVDGDLLYTQEQRGEDEIVACYRVSTGEPVWRHRDRVRFWESNGGAGPRSTPTLDDDRVYTFGATGILNALDARSGKLLWSRNVSTDLNRRVPDWGLVQECQHRSQPAGAGLGLHEFAACHPGRCDCGGGGNTGGVQHRVGPAALARPAIRR